ncbi:MAG: tyrosine-type recombinase/integrase [Alphaproteobacteria bacterium]|nr:tyrosine-type recombinase/integrase [Alphaproteobacteria bacterium]
MSLPIAEAVQVFLDHCRIAKCLSAHTLRAYESDLGQFTAFAGSSGTVRDVERDLLRDYARFLFDQEKLKETSVRRKLATLKVMFRWLESEEAIEITPFHRLQMPIRLPKRLPKALAPAEIRDLLLATKRRCLDSDDLAACAFYLALLILFATGLRVGELTSVRLKDIETEDGVILVRGKGNRERRVYLTNKDVLAVLKAYLRARRSVAGADPNGRLLIDGEGIPITAQRLRRQLHRLALLCGFKKRVTPHMLRHTAATQLIEAGVDIRFVQKLLGHASIATTQIYTQVSDASLRATLARANTLGRVMR